MEKCRHSANTDGILIKLFQKEDKDKIISICNEWSKRTRMDLEFSEFKKVIQKDVNNYLIIPEGELYDSKGKELFKRKGAFVKELSKLDNDLPIVNRAVLNYFLYHKPVESTIMESDKLIDFQKITKIGGSYEYAFKETTKGSLHNYTKVTTKRKKTGGVSIEYEVEVNCDSKGVILPTKVNRCFASTHHSHGQLLKKAKNKTSLDKIASTPDKCFIVNTSVVDEKVPPYLDRNWYIDLAKERIEMFVGKK